MNVTWIIVGFFMAAATQNLTFIFLGIVLAVLLKKEENKI